MAQEKIGRFTVIRLISSGGQAEVFEARDPKLERPVAIKRILREKVQDRTALERLRREAQSAFS
jgi:serine/threonine protein kinase